MKYRGITTKNGKTFIRKRKSVFETKDFSRSKFSEFTDHTEMKTWEYAAFQKEQFNQIKKRRRRFYITVIAATIIAFMLVFLIPFIIEFVRSFGQPIYKTN
jgi:lipopolysaccharide/colanic/teichoic acid biosynthesis glycosyltransferase